MDDMDLVQEAEAARAEMRLAERLRRIEATANVKPPKSRKCADCGCNIPKARLQARPTTRYCVDCQNDLEQGRR